MLSYEKRAGYLYLEYSEKYEYRKVIDLAHELEDICRDENHNKVLVKVVGLVEDIGTLDKFRLAVEMARIIRSPKQIAVLVQEGSIDRFTETVAVNRGLNVRLFNEAVDALKWLNVGVE